jgi:hypothetical protein
MGARESCQVTAEGSGAGEQAIGMQCCRASRDRVGPHYRRGSRMSRPFTLSSRFGSMLLDGGFASGPES